MSFRSPITPATAYTPVGPINGTPDTAVAAESAIDLRAHVGSFVRITVDPEATGFVLVGMRAAADGTLVITDGTAIGAQLGVAKIGAGQSLEFSVSRGFPYLVHKRSGSTDTKVFINIT